MKVLKTYLTSFIIFIGSVIYGQSDFSGIVQYESTIGSKKLAEYLSTKRKNIKNKALVKSLDQVFLYTKAIKSTLTFSEGKGLFVVEDKLSTNIHDLGQRINKTSAGGSKEYYYNVKDKVYLIKDCATLGECFIFDNNYLEWQLTQETRTINGYVTYKATRNNGKVIAWYTPSIPIGFGPKGEYGLPGLIIELELGKIVFKATKITLNPKNKFVVKEPKSGKRVTYEEYSEIMKKARKSIFGN